QALLPAVVLLPVARRGARRPGRGHRARDVGASDLPVQLERLRAQLRSQPEAGLRRPPPQGDPAEPGRARAVGAPGARPRLSPTSRGRQEPWLAAKALA